MPWLIQKKRDAAPMISYSVYKLLHIIGLTGLLLTTGAALLASSSGAQLAKPIKRKLFIGHGISLFLLLLAGFGMLARLGIGTTDNPGWPNWVILKIVVWLILGGSLALIIRKPELSRMMWVVITLLVIFSAWLAIFKPF